MTDTVTRPKTKVRTKTERPRLHKVILVNDDYTPREFVVTVLKAEFRMTEDQAHKVMITAHQRGVCVVAVFTKDVAETKATRATDAGRAITRGIARDGHKPGPPMAYGHYAGLKEADRADIIAYLRTVPARR